MDIDAGVMYVARTPASVQILDPTHSRLTTVRLVRRDAVSLRDFRFLRLRFLAVRRVCLERRPPVVDFALTVSTTALELAELDSVPAAAEELASAPLADEPDLGSAAYNTVDNPSNPD